MRWTEPETLPADIDDPVTFDAGMLFIGLAVVGMVWVFVVMIAALVVLALDVLGWH